MDVLDSPVPALVGVQAPFEVPVLDPLGYALEGVVVLDLDARPASVRQIVLYCIFHVFLCIYCMR